METKSSKQAHLSFDIEQQQVINETGAIITYVRIIRNHTVDRPTHT